MHLNRIQIIYLYTLWNLSDPNIPVISQNVFLLFFFKLLNGQFSFRWQHSIPYHTTSNNCIETKSRQPIVAHSYTWYTTATTEEDRSHCNNGWKLKYFNCCGIGCHLYSSFNYVFVVVFAVCLSSLWWIFMVAPIIDFIDSWENATCMIIVIIIGIGMPWGEM